MSFPALNPQGLRHSPIHGILLTNADLDHVLGLYLLREGYPLSIHTTPAIRACLELGLNLQSTLRAYCGIIWQTPSYNDYQPLLDRDGQTSGLSYRAIPLHSSPPPYCRYDEINGIHSVAYLLRDDRTQSSILIAPDVGWINMELEAAWQNVDALFLDGTFWSDDELQQIKPSSRSAREIGHVPIFPEVLARTRDLPAKLKIFLHINNTNPIWNPQSPQRQTMELAGWQIGRDGWDLEV